MYLAIKVVYVLYYVKLFSLSNSGEKYVWILEMNNNTAMHQCIAIHNVSLCISIRINASTSLCISINKMFCVMHQ